jgi:1,4-alpha-glucan branching enzyme
MNRRASAAAVVLALAFLLEPCLAQGPSADVDSISWWEVQPVGVGDSQPQLRITTTEVQGSGADLYVRFGKPPTLTQYDAVSKRSTTSNEEIVLHGETNPQLVSGTWYVGVHRPPGTLVDLDFQHELIPSLKEGMGATPYPPRVRGGGGVSFRTWAPFAQGVYLVGDFQGWIPWITPMAAESNGHWSLDVRGLGDGAQYKYVIWTGSQLLWRADPRARDLVNSAGNSVVLDSSGWNWSGPAYGTPAWNDLVIYELHVGTFEDQPGGAPGTFASAIQRLDDLVEIGVNAVELMPVCEFPADFSWGYNYSHPFAIETAYGGAEGLQQFVREAHARGIAVLLDVLYNHWGPNDLPHWVYDGWSISPWGGIYFYNSVLAQTPWGDTRPDFGRPEVRSYIRDNVMYWLDEFQVDGYRWDSTSNIRKGPLGDIPEGWSLMQWCNDEIDNFQPWKISIAEDMYEAPNDWITKDTGAGGAGFDSQWDALFVHPIRAAVITPNDDNRNMWEVRNAIAHYYNGDAFQRVIYTESHDEVANGKSRLPEEIFPGQPDSYWSKKRSTLAAAIVLTSPGIPMLFQGQELLEDGHFEDTDPVDWTKKTTFAGIRLMYGDLIRLRRDWYATTRGLKGNNTNVHHVNDVDKVIAYHRWDQGGPGDDVVVVANFRNQSWNSYRIGLPRAGVWKVRFNSDWSGYDPGFGDHPSLDVTAQSTPWDGMPFSAELSFGPYTAVILSQ